MANRHFGEIGDVWKHLPLAELLAIERPRCYWESHAGSARYALSRTWQRDHGVYYFLEHAGRSPVLDAARYRTMLAGMPQRDGQPSHYPGSPLLAMLERGHQAHEYVFGDLDPESIADLQATAQTMGLAARVHCILDDGIATLWEKAATLSAEDAACTLVQIDPYDPLEAGGRSGLSSVDLCCTLAERGCKVVLWYGLDTAEERGWAWQLIAPRLAGAVCSLWCGEMALRALNGAELPPNPGARGCGVLCANLSQAATDACARLGAELAALYEGSMLPQETSGAIDFSERAHKA